MYCGDETGSFIGEVGSSVSRFGYGGEDSPKYVVDSSVVVDDKGARLAPSPLRQSPGTYHTPMRRVQVPENHPLDQPIADPTLYLQQGDSIEDWDAFEAVWESALCSMHVRDHYKHTRGGNHAGGVATTNLTAASTTAAEARTVHPLLVVVPGATHKMGRPGKDVHRKEMVKLTELVMEKFQSEAVFIAPAPMLAAFSHGRQTALVVDVGAGGCRVTPVVDGLLLKQAQRRSGRGGDWLANVQWKALMENKTVLRPRYQVRHPEPSADGVFHRLAMHALLYEFRSSEHVYMPQWWYDPSVPFCYDSDMDVDKPDTASAAAATTYELPDGTLIDLTSRVGKDLCRLPELLLTNDLPFVDQTKESSILSEHATLSNLPLHRLIQESLSAVGDVDTRKDLAGTILLTGGSALFTDFEKRLSLELPRLISSAYKCKVLASQHSIERSCASWIGGSILSSLGSFQQLWLSKTEYQEYGATLAVQRFP